jgi:integrase
MESSSSQNSRCSPKLETNESSLEPGDFKTVFQALPENLHPLIQFLYDTGGAVPEQRKNFDRTCVHLELDEPEIWLPAMVVKHRKPFKVPLSAELAGMLRKQFQVAGQVFCSTDLRKAWHKACVAVGFGTMTGENYSGLLIHDLRRSGVRNLIRAGVDETVAMKISGHLTTNVFKRYNITSTEDLHIANERLARYTENLATSQERVKFAVMTVNQNS